MEYMMKLSEIYKFSFENRCFQLLIEAYNVVFQEKNIQPNWNENDISQEIYEKLDVNPNRLRWYISASREYHLSQDVVKIKGFADKLPRIDLRMTSITSGLEYKYFCEAKRLKEKDLKLKKAYIDDGMDRYISKKYPFGCMLGYLLEGKTDETIKGINYLLQSNKRNSEVLTLKSHKLLKSVYESNHLHIGTITHLIFDLTTTSHH